MYYAHNVELIRSGVDWLTATFAGEEGERARWANKGIRVLERCKSEGEDLKPRYMLGFKGVGFKNCFVGAREDDTMIQLTGKYAHRHFKDIMRGGLHISRIDVQCTVKHYHMPDDIVDRTLSEMKNAIAIGALPANMKGFRYTELDNSGTAYIGAPSSQQQGKVYNKAKQSGEKVDERSWRYEVKYKDERAVPIAYQIFNADKRWVAECARIVRAWFRVRFIEDEWNIDADLTILPILHLEKTDTQRQLQWLRTQVAPTIDLLREKGYIADAYEALGLRTSDEGFKLINYHERKKGG